MSKLTGDQNLVKKINKSIVKRAIEKKGPISRSQISKETGLNKATVSTMVNELIQDQFVNEIGSGKSSGGRKPVMLYFNYSAGYSIGIDVGVNYILAVLTNLKGEIAVEIYETLSGIEVDDVINHIHSIISRLIDRAPQSHYGIIGIGIGIPGLVNKDGIVLFTPHLNLKQINLKEAIENKFKIPTVINNEANSGAHGEQIYGAGKNVSQLIYASFGMGIGTGIIINNQLFTGSTGISGEMGHHTVETGGKKCRCGNQGCWELYASESALLLQAKERDLFKQTDKINLEMIEQKAEQGNENVLQIIDEIGGYIGIGLTNIINTFNPEMIILGNRISRLEKWLNPAINRTLGDRLSTFHRESVTITFASLNTYSSALGSSAFAITHFLDDNQVTVT